MPSAGRPAGQVSSLNAQAAALKTAINDDFWIPAKGMYGYFIHGADSMRGQLYQTEEGAGLSFAILFGIATPAQAESIMQNTDIQPAGIVDTYPNFARYSGAQPGRHNVTVRPMVQGYWADAAAQSGDQSRFASEVESLARLADSGNEFYEAYTAQTGVPDGGWQTGSHWSAAPDQTWSATAYLRMISTGNAGLCLDVRGAATADLTPVQIYTCDGTNAQQWNVVTADNTLRSLGKCLDVKNGGTGDGTTVDLYTCNGADNETAAASAATRRRRRWNTG